MCVACVVTEATMHARPSSASASSTLQPVPFGAVKNLHSNCLGSMDSSYLCSLLTP